MSHAVKEHPILFTAEMIRANLDFRKTQTRRPLTLPKWSTGNWNDLEIDENGTPFIICKKTGCLAEIPCRYGKPGDRLWARENFYERGIWRNSDTLYGESDKYFWQPTFGVPIRYAADYPAIPTEKGGYTWRHKPNIFLRREDSRILLEMTARRVEPLNSISQEDALAEGTRMREFPQGKRYSMEDPFPENYGETLATPRAAFLNFINRLHGGSNWNFWYSNSQKYKMPLSEQNPLVWVIGYKVLEVKRHG